MTDTQLDNTPRAASPWDAVQPRLRAAGLRWTPQRRTLVEVLRGRQGHVTAGEAIAAALAKDLGFEIDLSHVTVSGLCRHCRE